MSPTSAPEAPPSTLKVAGVVTFYIIAAILMVTVNKWVLLTTSIPIFFLFVQLLIAVILLQTFHAFGVLSIPAWDTITVKKLVPLIGVNVTGLIFNNLCLQYVDASVYQIARGLVLPITVGLAFGLHQSTPSIRAAMCCLGITVGWGVGVVLDKHSTTGPRDMSLLVIAGWWTWLVECKGRDGSLQRFGIGIVFGVLSSCTTALHSIVIKSSLPHVNNSAILLAWYTNALSTVAIVPVFVLMGELKGVVGMLGDGEELVRFAWGGVITGVVGFLICIAGFLSIKVTSPVTHMVSSASRGVIQTLLSVWFFGDIISGARATSIFLITLASMAYVWVKHTEANAPAANTSSGGRSRGGNEVLFDREREDEVPLTSAQKQDDV